MVRMDFLEEENYQLKSINDELKTNSDQLMKEVIKLRHVDSPFFKKIAVK